MTCGSLRSPSCEELVNSVKILARMLFIIHSTKITFANLDLYWLFIEKQLIVIICLVKTV